MTREDIENLSNEELISALEKLDIEVPKGTERWRLIGMILGDCDDCQEAPVSGNQISVVLTMKVKNSKLPARAASFNNKPNKEKKPCPGCGKN